MTRGFGSDTPLPRGFDTPQPRGFGSDVPLIRGFGSDELPLLQVEREKDREGMGNNEFKFEEGFIFSISVFFKFTIFFAVVDFNFPFICRKSQSFFSK